MALQGLLALAGGSWNAAMPRLSSPCRSDCRLPAPCRTAVCMKERAVVIGGNGEADEEDTLDIMDVGASGMNRVDVGQEDWLFFDRARIRVTAGDGGDGCVAFRREKDKPKMGPSNGSATACASPARAPMNEKHSGKKTSRQPVWTASSVSFLHMPKFAAASWMEVICTRPARQRRRG